MKFMKSGYFKDISHLVMRVVVVNKTTVKSVLTHLQHCGVVQLANASVRGDRHVEGRTQVRIMPQ